MNTNELGSGFVRNPRGQKSAIRSRRSFARVEQDFRQGLTHFAVEYHNATVKYYEYVLHPTLVCIRVHSWFFLV